MTDDDNYVDNHWAVALADAPEALVAVVDTKIARAELGERARIIALLLDGWCREDAPIIAAIKGENE